jgi:NADH:ubiquinone oxidoreductase subunit 6 (subunit J)
MTELEMSDINANQIIGLMLVFILVGALFVLNVIIQVKVGGRWLNGMKNSSGNYSVTKILLTGVAAVAVYVLITYMFGSKTTTRPSLTRSEEGYRS